MTAADPIPAVREADATGHTAAVFADLRTTLGVPFVNLIWRHLATMPGMLEWGWAVVKPLHAGDALHEAATRLCEGVAAPDGIAQPACVFDAVGVGTAERATIEALIRDYDTANAMNLLGLMTVQALLAGQRPGGEAQPPRTHMAPAPRVATPPLPGFDELAPGVRPLVMALDQFGRRGPTNAVASLYRHLGYWPGFLAVAHAALAPAQREGLLLAEHIRTKARAEHEVQDRLMRFAPKLEAKALDTAAAEASIQAFTDHMIARMVTMGEVLLALLPE